jgi:hypothetical protein
MTSYRVKASSLVKVLNTRIVQIFNGVEMDNKTRYKEYKLKGLLDSWEFYKKENPNAKLEKTLAKTFKTQFNITEDQYDAFVEEFSDIQTIKPKFTTKRQEDFDGDIVKFYDWYKLQPDCCGYCGITQKQLRLLFTNDENKVVPLNDNWSKNDKGTLQIERINSKTNSYEETNIILACPVCNNAKSNLIDEESWSDLFAPAMTKYYNKLLEPFGEKIKENTNE